MMKILTFWLLLLLHEGNGARILAFFPLGFKSHHHVFQPIVKELCQRGHNVTYYTPFTIGPLPNLEEVKIPEFNGLDIFKENALNFANTGALTLLRMWPTGEKNFADLVWNLPEMVELIHSAQHYDLVLHQAFLFQSSVSALVHKFHAIGVAVQPLGEFPWANEVSGLPDNPSYMVGFGSRFTDRMCFMERLQTAFSLAVLIPGMYYYTATVSQSIVDQYMNYSGWESRPNIVELMKNQALILSNSHHSVGYSYPKAPHHKEIGGVNVVQSKPLPPDLDKFMNESQHGVIYFSMGTNINWSHPVLTPARNAFVNTFSKMKENVLWKWSEPNPPKASPNVKFSKWFPQQDILAHKNLKLFITHGGLLSTWEAVSQGVQLLGIPMFGDQFKNMIHVENAGYGIQLKIDNITESSVNWALNELLHNSKYQTEAMRRSKLFRDRPMTPVDEAAYWIEYVLEHGNVLQPASVHMPAYQVYCLDLIGTVIAALIFIIWAVNKLFQTLIHCCAKPSKSVKKKKQ